MLLWLFLLEELPPPLRSPHSFANVEQLSNRRCDGLKRKLNWHLRGLCSETRQRACYALDIVLEWKCFVIKMRAVQQSRATLLSRLAVIGIAVAVPVQNPCQSGLVISSVVATVYQFKKYKIHGNIVRNNCATSRKLVALSWFDTAG